jgi:hypothetical protein
MAISLRRFLLESEVGKGDSGGALVPSSEFLIEPKRAAHLVVDNYVKQGKLKEPYIFSAYSNFKIKIVHFDLPELRDLVKRMSCTN